VLAKTRRSGYGTHELEGDVIIMMMMMMMMDTNVVDDDDDDDDDADVDAL